MFLNWKNPAFTTEFTCLLNLSLSLNLIEKHSQVSYLSMQIWGSRN